LLRARRSGNLPPMNFDPSKLFHAVVIAGAALTGGAVLANHSTSSSNDTNAVASTSQTTVTPQAGGTCPPGSERPYPPCYWIK
jgi:hypothetical protein